MIAEVLERRDKVVVFWDQSLTKGVLDDPYKRILAQNPPTSRTIRSRRIDERTESIIYQLLQMPHIVQRQVLDDLRFLSRHCSDLHSVAIAAVNKAEQKAGQNKKIG